MIELVEQALAAGGAGPALDELVAISAALGDGGSVLADALWLIDVTSTVAASAESVANTAMADVVRSLVARGALPAALALERLDAPVLESAGVLASSSLFARKVVRANTALLYRQQRYNLLREEPEGYARVALFARAALVSSSVGLDAQSSLASLVGCFDLDPVRVSDVVLDAFMALGDASSVESALHLLAALGLPPRTLDSVLGQRLASIPALSERLSMRLVDAHARYGTIAAHAVAANLATAGGVMAHIMASPGLSTAAESLASAIGAIEGALSDSHGSAMRPARETFESLVSTGASHAIPFFAAGLLSADRLGLALCVLRGCDSGFALHPAVARSACSALLSDVSDRERTDALLSLLGPSGLSADIRAYTAVCGLVTHDSVASVLSTLIPALGVMHPARDAADALWSCLSALPVSLRFGLYSLTEDAQRLGDALSIACSRAVGDAARRALRRLTRDNAATVGMALAAAAVAQPAPTASVVVARVLAYESMAAPIAALLPSFGPLVRDCMVRAALAVYAGSASAADGGRTRSDGAPSAWMCALASFLASLSVLDIDEAVRRGEEGALQSVAIVVQTAIQQMLAWKTPADSVVVRALVSGATGVEPLRDPSDAHVDAFAGGRVLRYSVWSSASTRSVRMSNTDRDAEDQRYAQRTAVLFAVLDREALLAPLCVALLRVCSAATTAGPYRDSGNERSVRLMRGETDEARATFRQLVTALESAPSAVKDSLRSTLPSAWDLVEHHSAVPADASVLWRAIGGDSAALQPFQSACALAAVFWSHALQDLVFPAARYASEIQRLRSLADKTPSPHCPTLAALEDEMRTRDEHVRRTRVRLAQALMRATCEWSAEEVGGRLFSAGFLPRAVASAEDALYCASFVLLLADVFASRESAAQSEPTDEDGAIACSTLQTLLGPLYASLPGVLLGSTDDEATALGRMLSSALSAAPSDAPPALHAAFTSALSPITSATRTAIIAMTHTLAVYPAHRADAAVLEDAIAPLRAHDAPEDLRVLAARYLTLLNRAHPTWTTLAALVPGAVSISDAPVNEPGHQSSPDLPLAQVPDLSHDIVEGPDQRSDQKPVQGPDTRSAQGPDHIPGQRSDPGFDQTPLQRSSQRPAQRVDRNPDQRQGQRFGKRQDPPLPRAPRAPAASELREMERRLRESSPAHLQRGSGESVPRTPSAELRVHEDRLRRSMSGVALADRPPLPADRPGSAQERPGALHERPGALHERPSALHERPNAPHERSGTHMDRPQPQRRQPMPEWSPPRSRNAPLTRPGDDRWARLGERRSRPQTADDRPPGAPPPIDIPPVHDTRERPISRPTRPTAGRFPEHRRTDERHSAKRGADAGDYATGEPSFPDDAHGDRPPPKRPHARRRF